MIIALFPNEKKDTSLKIAIEISHFLQSKNVTVAAEDKHAIALGAQNLSSISPDDVSFRISLGGDGTILRLVHRHPALRAPLLGINLGSLGFLADIPIDDIYPSLTDLLEGRYVIQERLMMEGLLSTDECCFAVNEIVIHRAQNPCLIDLAIHVDGRYLNTFSADGIIISTPGGSTAYSLAAGGPILTPEMDAFVITPICPHTISNRPLVLMPKQSIEITYLNHYLPAEISADGTPYNTLDAEKTFVIMPSSKTFSLVALTRHDYFSTLREKLGWQGRMKSITPRT